MYPAPLSTICCRTLKLTTKEVFMMWNDISNHERVIPFVLIVSWVWKKWLCSLGLLTSIGLCPIVQKQVCDSKWIQLLDIADLTSSYEFDFVQTDMQVICKHELPPFMRKHGSFEKQDLQRGRKFTHQTLVHINIIVSHEKAYFANLF